MSEQTKRSGKEVIEDGLKDGLNKLQSLFKHGNLPGKVLLKRGQAKDRSKHTTGSRTASREITPRSEGSYAASSPEPLSPNASAASSGVQHKLETLELRGGEGTSTSGNESPQASSATRFIPSHRIQKFQKILNEQVVDLDALREISWNGIPTELRPQCWRLLLGYLPPNRSRQAAALARKRREYAEMVPMYYDIANSERLEDEVGALRQVVVDVPRTAPGVAFVHEQVIQKSLERLLYIWGVRHPASGYVQGMNDLVTPFLAVFLSEVLGPEQDSWQPATLPEDSLLEIEADCYWCLCKLLEGIQDHYTDAQPGIQKAVFRLKELVRAHDKEVAGHLEAEGLDFLQFAFRWVNCLLIREVPFPLAVRLWDTYLAEGVKFPEYLVYLCAAFLLTWAAEIKQMDFQELVLFLQKLPTQGWDIHKMELVLANAFVIRAQYANSPMRLSS